MQPKKNPEVDLEKRKGLLFELGLLISLSVVLLAFEWKSFEGGLTDLGQLQVDNTEEEIIPITQQNQPPPPPPPPPPVQEILEIVEDDKEIEDEVEIQDSEADQNTEIFDMPEEVVEEAEVFLIVEDMPVFQGCEGISNKQQRDACTQQKILQHIASNTKYPPMMKDAGISGMVFIEFVVDGKGNVTNVKVLRGVTGGKMLDEEAVRVVKTLPDFKPGKQRGKNVSVKYNIPVRFNLKN